MAATKPLIYLGGPFSHTDAEVRRRRYWQLSVASALLIRRGEHVITPVTMFYGTDMLLFADNLGGKFWGDYVLNIAAACGRFAVQTVPGWQESPGLKLELDHFAARGIEPEMISEADIANFGPAIGRMVD